MSRGPTIPEIIARLLLLRVTMSEAETRCNALTLDVDAHPTLRSVATDFHALIRGVRLNLIDIDRLHRKLERLSRGKGA
jgi:hypothetical protein